MRKIVAAILLCSLALTANAVPAKRGWQTRTQADGSSIEVQVIGDEFYHYTINREGKQIRLNEAGMYEVVGEAPSAAKVKAKRAEGQARRQRKDVGTTPNLAPKGVVILANFSNKSMQSGHTQATFDELCNSLNCTVNSGYPSAGQYFADQSNGSYRPQFDVFGPVTLSRNVAYYGTDNTGEEEGDDQHATDAVVEACRLANDQYTINWSDYDSDNDGYVDFVYVIYAGKGQADGGTSETIWPHNWDVTSAIEYGYCTYTNAQRTLGGKKIDNYAMSSELSGNALGGIGTLCHEFGHVMGLPDLYDTSYGTNYNNSLTPNDWNIMDGGSYNADGHCPPNYDPWEKEFFGWHTPINLGNEGQNVTLYANGTANYQAYQINASGNYVSPTTPGVRYYIENRQAQGWDEPLTGHGMLIWKVNFNATKWTNNEPNNTANNPYYTIVSAYGSAIGWDGSTDNCKWNTFPGTKNKTSYTGISGKPLLNIAESNQLITLTYIEEPTTPVDPFDVVFKVNGVDYETIPSTGKLILPSEEPAACSVNRVFVGWCSQANYSSETTAPTLAKANDAVSEGAVFYAVFADKEETSGSGVQQTNTYTFTSKSWADATKSWTSIKDGNQLTSGQGVQVTAGVSGAGAELKTPVNNVTKMVIKYCTNASKGVGSIKVEVGNASVSKNVTKTGGTTLRDLEFDFNNASGDLSFVVTCTTNSIYVNSISITSGGGSSVVYSNYSTSCGGGESIVETIGEQEKTVKKAIRNGQLVIIRGEEVYSITGERIE